jgi:hypothetical protein
MSDDSKATTETLRDALVRDWADPGSEAEALARDLDRLLAAARAESDALRAALEEWQRYAGGLGGALISMGHHVAAKHQSPQEYDSESGLACSIPSCLADLANRYRAALAPSPAQHVNSMTVGGQVGVGPDGPIYSEREALEVFLVHHADCPGVAAVCGRIDAVALSALRRTT